MRQAACEPVAISLTPPARAVARFGPGQGAGGVYRALGWSLATAGILAVAAAWLAFIGGADAAWGGVGAANGFAMVGIALLSFLGLGGAAVALTLQRSELLLQRGEREKAERQARDGDGRHAEVEARLRECEHQLRWLSE